MPYKVYASRPKTLEDINPGEIYEAQLFTIGELMDLANTWRIGIGLVLDDGPHNGTQLVRFLDKVTPEDSNG